MSDDGETQYCTHTTDGTICDRCMGGIMSDTLERLEGHVIAGMGWSTARPKVAGWYWYRSAASPLYERIIEIEPIDIAGSEEDPDYYEKTGEWSGPIPLPTDAPAQGFYRAEEVEAAVLEMVTANSIGHGVCLCSPCQRARQLLDRLRKERG